MLTEAATRKNTYEQILDRLVPLASSYNASSSVEMTVISGRTHKDNLADFYPLLLDAVRLPAFKQEDFERLRDSAYGFPPTVAVPMIWPCTDVW